MQPTISVVIPVFNGEKFIREAISSALEQTYSPKEVIVIDDGSTDGTPSVLESFGDKIIPIRQANQGLPATRNVGVKAASGDWVAFLDADDYWFPEKLEKQVAALNARPNADFVYTGRTQFYSDGKTLEVPADPVERTKRILRFENPIIPSTILIRRSVLLENPWPPDLRIAEDWFYFHKLSRLVEFTCVEESMLHFRIHDESLTHRDWKKVLTYAREAAKRIQCEYNGLDRLLLHLRVEARLRSNAAIAAREQDGTDFLPLMSQSLLYWPFPDVRPNRYKVFTKMLLQSLSGTRRPAKKN